MMKAQDCSNGAAEAAARTEFDWPPASEVDLGRADAYRLLALLFEAPPMPELLAAIGGMASTETEFGRAVEAVAERGAALGPERLRAIYNGLFVGAPGAPLSPYGSHYLNGHMFGRSLAELRMDLARLGVSRREDATEPEDHAAIICEVMSGLIIGAFGRPPSSMNEQAEFFDKHIASWLLKFLADLEGADPEGFYAATAELGRVFIALEKQAFAMA